MATAGWRALAARTTARLRAIAAPRSSVPPSDADRASWRSILSRTRARLSAAADARDGDAVRRPIRPTAGVRGEDKVSEQKGNTKLKAAEKRKTVKKPVEGNSKLNTKCTSPKCKENHIVKASPKASPHKIQLKVVKANIVIEVSQEKVKINLKEAATNKPVTEVSLKKPGLKAVKEYNTMLAPKKTGIVEKVVEKAEGQVNIARRISNVFKNAAQALAGISLGTSLILYQKDKLADNYRKAKEALQAAFPSNKTDEEPAPQHEEASNKTDEEPAPQNGEAPDAVENGWFLTLRDFLFGG